MTQISGSTKLFTSPDSAFTSRSDARESFVSYKSTLSTETLFNKKIEGNENIPNIIPFEKTVKKDHVGEQVSSKSDSDSMYNSKSGSDTKKHYKLLPANLKLEII